MKIIAVIPARASSSRFYNKPLAKIRGIPMIQHVVNNTRGVKLISEVIVATDSNEIFDFCNEIFVKCVMTSKGCPTATDRLIEVANSYPADLYLMVNGDEPLVQHSDIEILIDNYLEKPSEFYVSNLMGLFSSHQEVLDVSNLKVVTNAAGRCLFISRSPIPYPKGEHSFDYKKFVGVQLYSKSALDFYSVTKPGIVEKIEENDSFRFIENSKDVYFYLFTRKTLSVDNPIDILVIENLLGG